MERRNQLSYIENYNKITGEFTLLSFGNLVHEVKKTVHALTFTIDSEALRKEAEENRTERTRDYRR